MANVSPSRRLRPMGMMTQNAEIPAGNLYTERQRRDQHWRLYEGRISQVKARLDNKPPGFFPHVRANLKKHQMQAEHASKIEYENQLLLRKLETISRPRPMTSELKGSVRPGVKLTSYQTPKLDNEKTLRYISAEPLRERVRREETQRIGLENLRIGKRLTEVKGNYSRPEFARFANAHKKYGDNMRKLRTFGYSRTSTPSYDGHHRSTSPLASYPQPPLTARPYTTTPTSGLRASTGGSMGSGPITSADGQLMPISNLFEDKPSPEGAWN